MSNGEPKIVYPGVYVVEIPSGMKVISGVETEQLPGARTRKIPFLVWLGYWGWGSVLAGVIIFIGYVLLLASDCIDPATSPRNAVTLGSCPSWVQRWYLVLRDWQTGIGATIGLLGVAWSTFFKSATSNKET